MYTLNYYYGLQRLIQGDIKLSPRPNFYPSLAAAKYFFELFGESFTMEGVENIAPLTDSTPSQVPNTTSASSSNNKNVPSAETATEQSTASQKKNTEGSSSTTNNVSSTSPPQLKWVTIETQRKNTRLPSLPLCFLEKN